MRVPNPVPNLALVPFAFLLSFLACASPETSAGDMEGVEKAAETVTCPPFTWATVGNVECVAEEGYLFRCGKGQAPGGFEAEAYCEIDGWPNGRFAELGTNCAELPDRLLQNRSFQGGTWNCESYDSSNSCLRLCCTGQTPCPRH